MSRRYTAQKTTNATVGVLDWYVRENHPDGQSARIMCYCQGELAAQEIAAALNHMDAITSHAWENRS